MVGFITPKRAGCFHGMALLGRCFAYFHDEIYGETNPCVVNVVNILGEENYNPEVEEMES